MNNRRRLLLAALVLPTLLTLTGCEVGYFIFGQGDQPAVFKIPEQSRVLVLVDKAANSPMTVSDLQSLINTMNLLLYQNKVATQFVPAFRLTNLQRNTELYQSMGIADIAAAVRADIVIYIYLRKFSAKLISDKQISEGYASAIVKVVNKNGTRLWPKDATDGYPITVKIPQALASSQSSAAVHNALIQAVAQKVALLFYSHPQSSAANAESSANQ